MKSTPRFFFLSAALLLSLGALAPLGAQHPIGFIEKFALGADRDAALKELIAGTEEYYFYHALHFQNTGRRAELDTLLAQWAKRSPDSALLREIRNREALLNYESSPQATLDYLKRTLGVSFNHQQDTLHPKPNLPTALDPKSIAAEMFQKEALKDVYALDGSRVTDLGIEYLLVNNVPLSVQQRRILLQRVTRPDVPHLVDVILVELNAKDSRGFGQYPIHHKLLLEQLEQLAKAKPDLLKSDPFVREWLARLHPGEDTNVERDAKVRAAWMDALWAFAQKLSPSFNSLKAHILYHRLVHDEESGAPNEARFLEYLKLPRNQGYVNEKYRENADVFRHPVNMNEGFEVITQRPPVGNDEPLVHRYLLRFLKDAPGKDAYAPYIASSYLKHVLAEAKLLGGVGNAENWFSMLSPAEVQELRERVDIEFDVANPSAFAPDSIVSLDVNVKNVPHLAANIFEINTENFHRTHLQQIGTDLDLDGLVANQRLSFDYTDAPILRTKRTFKLGDLPARRGVWMVDFIGNGRSSRALIRKGQLDFVTRASSAGNALTVLDESRKPILRAYVLLGGQRYNAGEKGEILIPFSNAAGLQSVILGDGAGFTQLEQVTLQGENYQLAAGFHVPRESLLSGKKATIAIRPTLTMNGAPVSVDLLEEVKLTIVSVTQDSVSSSTVKSDFKLFANKESTVDINVPDRLASLQFTLEGKVKHVITGEKTPLSTGTGIQLNQTDRTEATSGLFLSSVNGEFILQELGRTGEPRSERAVSLKLWRNEFTQPVEVELKTDDAGKVHLGPLDGISRMVARQASGLFRTWDLPEDRASVPGNVHITTDQAVYLPWLEGNAKPVPPLVSLIEVRQGLFVRSVVSDKNVSVRGGYLVIDHLDPGDYSLRLGHDWREMNIRVAKGDEIAGWIIGVARHLQARVSVPLQIESVNTAKDQLVISLENVTPDTRVHIVTSRFLPEHDIFDELGSSPLPQPLLGVPSSLRSLFVSGRTLGEEYRYVLERHAALKFPGVMLPRPGLLLNPWELRTTETGLNEARAGEVFRREADGKSAAVTSAAAPPPAKPGLKAKNELGYDASGGADQPASVDFLGDTGFAAWNLVPDKDGKVTLKLSDLGDRQFVRIFAVNGRNSVVRDLSLPDAKTKLRDLTLRNGLDPNGHFTRQNQVTILEKDAPFTIKDASTAQFEAQESLASAFDLLRTLSKDNTLPEFAFLLEWPKFDAAKKQELYSRYACHELSFFLQRKDPTFFKAVILPYLANKRDKTFLDHYLLGDDLHAFLRPWSYQRLNIVERILLAQRHPEEAAATAREVSEMTQVLPPNIEQNIYLFDTALSGKDLETDELKLSLGKSTVLGRLTTSKDAPANAPASPALTLSSNNSYTGGTTIAGGTVVMGGTSGTLTKSGSGRLVLNGGAVTLEAENVNGSLSTVRQLNVAASSNSLGDLDRANKELQDALRIDPNNVAARRGVEEIEKQRAYYFEAARDHKRAKMLNEVNAGWEDNVAIKFDTEARKQTVAELYRKLDPTKEWAENNYYHLPIEQQLAGLITVNGFWKDYAAWDGKGGFLSTHLAEASHSFAEVMFALAVLDLPFPADAKAPKVDVKDLSVTLTPTQRLILFHRELKPAEMDKEAPRLLVSQNFYRNGDRYLQKDGEKQDKFVTEEFLTGVVYGCQVVVTNPTSSTQKLDLLLQIPQGAIPVLGSKPTDNRPLTLESYRTFTIDYYFYFPRPGKFAHHPVHVSKAEKVVAFASPFSFNVVNELTKLDTQSWDYVSQFGKPEDVLSFLESHNLHLLNLDRMAWRLRDAGFYRQAIALLAKHHVYHPTTWSYSILNNDADGLREYLQHADGFMIDCGPTLSSKLINIDPVSRYGYQHLEYSPLVNARAHQLGAQRTLLNNRLTVQYQSLLNVLAHRASLDDEDRLAVSYYLFLQDRIEEALADFAAVDVTKISEKLQYDYMKAVASLYQGDAATARQIAQNHAQHPVDRWKDKFAEVLAQLDEIEGKKPDKIKDDDREQRQNRLATSEPTLDFSVENREVKLAYHNIKEVTVNYYPMDLEFLFSSAPFVGQNTSRFGLIQPNKTEHLQLPADKEAHLFALPKEYHSSNVLVEIISGAKIAAHAYYANELNVQISENYGRLQVLHAGDNRPLARTYVKVFAEIGGVAKFYKDGYTDLRGKFDYLSLSTGEMDQAVRFSILILSDEFGAAVREVKPPRQ